MSGICRKEFRYLSGRYSGGNLGITAEQDYTWSGHKQTACSVSVIYTIFKKRTDNNWLSKKMYMESITVYFTGSEPMSVELASPGFQTCSLTTDPFKDSETYYCSRCLNFKSYSFFY